MYSYVFLRIPLYTCVHNRKERLVPTVDEQQMWFKNGVKNR